MVGRKKNRILTDALREVKHTKNRFLSMLLMAALSVAFLAGLRTTAPDMKYTADAYFDAQKLMDIRVLSTLGLDDEDLKALRAVENVSAVEGGYQLDAVCGENILTVISMPQTLNLPALHEGRLPVNAAECLAEQAYMDAHGLAIGDTLTLNLESSDHAADFHCAAFTIVGIADNPLYISMDRGSSSLGTGQVNAFIMVPEAAFALDYYTVAYLAVADMEPLLSYSDAYEDAVEQIIDAIEAHSDENVHLRYERLLEEPRRTLAEAEADYAAAQKDISAELIEAEQELADGRQELDEGWAEYEDGLATLARETRDAEQKINDAVRELADAELELADGEISYEEGLTELTDGETEYIDSLEELTQAQVDFDEGIAEYEDGMRELAEAEQELADAKKELSAASRALDAGESELQKGREALALEQERFAQMQALYEVLLAVEEPDEMAIAQMQGMLQAMLAQVDDTTEEGAQTAAQLQGILDMLADEQTQELGYQYGLAAIGTALAQTELALSAAQAQLDSAADSLLSGHAAYTRGWRQYSEGLQEYEDGKQKLAEAKLELDDAEVELAEAWQALAEGREELDEGWQELTDARAELDEGIARYEEGLAELQDARATLRRETADAQAELADALEELNDGEREYQDGLQEYEDGKAEADAELADARRKLDDAQKEIDDVEEGEWYVLGRNTLMGYVNYGSDAERMSNLATVFPVIFFLVAALASLTSMTRMVEEQRTQIGCLKALGFGRIAVSFKYIGYSLTASLLGGLIGAVAGCLLIPSVIYHAWGIMYTLPPLIFLFQPMICIVAIGAAVLCTTGASALACYSTLRATPANLMRPRAPKAGKRIFLERISPLWSRLKFIQKVTARNLLRYQRRFWMTVIGIGGCTALIVTGFGLHNSIFDILSLQYDEITPYTASVGLQDKINVQELSDIRAFLDGEAQVSSYLCSHHAAVDTSTENGIVESVTLSTVEEAETFRSFVHLRHRGDDTAVEMPQDGVLIDEKLSELLGVSIGDMITIDGARRVTVRVSDVVENYVSHYIYLTEDYYATLFGENPVDNTIMLNLADTSEEGSNAISRTLMQMPGVSSYSYIAAVRDNITDSMASIDYAVIIIILAAAALAFVVLYNLTNISITERMRELATLKVLGFYDREVSDYIYRENMVLTAVGIFFGLFLGRALHAWLIRTVEINMLMFGRSAATSSYVLAALLTVVFSVIVNIVAHFSLKKVSMIESLKSVE